MQNRKFCTSEHLEIHFVWDLNINEISTQKHILIRTKVQRLCLGFRPVVIIHFNTIALTSSDWI